MRLVSRAAFAAICAGAFTLSGSALAADISLEHIGRYQPPPEEVAFDEGVSEIVAYDAANAELYVVNAKAAAVEILSLADPANPTWVGEIDVAAYGGIANSVAVKDGIVAIAVEAFVKQDPGSIVFFDTNRTFLSQVQVGALPDNVVFSPNGRYAIAACEGEPNDSYSRDPEGVIAVVDLAAGAHAPTVKIADFRAYNGATLDDSVRVFGPGSTVAQDFEPEYVAVSHDSKTAWVTLQENNAIATVDLRAGRVTKVTGLGFKNHALPGNGLDASDRDSAINIANWPVFGMYLPDTIGSFRVRGATYLVMANEGDSRAYSAFDEETRVGSVALDPTAFPNAAELKGSSKIGRLKMTKTLGDTDGDGDYDEIYAFGARSFTIRKPSGEIVYDSGDQLEQLVATSNPAHFNASNDTNAFDNRSDDKGPEPEGIAVGKAWGRTLIFVGLERMGGVVTVDATNPQNPEILDYNNPRDFTKDPAADILEVGDVGPEGLLFIHAEDSPNGQPLLVVGNEISGTTSVYQLHRD